MRIRPLALALALLAALAASAAAQGSPFTPVGDDPVVDDSLTVGASPMYQDPGAVVIEGDTFHMFHNGFSDWPAKVGIFHSTSNDGVTWTASDDTPVLTEAALPYDTFTLLASSALIEDDGSWALWFYTWDAQMGSAGSRIGRATAPGPRGPWTPDPEPALAPGDRDAWDGRAVRSPSVVRDGDGYAMVYTGVSRFGIRNIGLATSDDGATWIKHDDPATTDDAMRESDPVFGKGESGSWDRVGAYQPRVRRTPDGWVMLYRGLAGADQTGRLGIALSADGVAWERHSANPVLAADAVPGGRAIWFAELEYLAGSYYLFFELGTGGKTEIYLATFEGSLAP